MKENNLCLIGGIDDISKSLFESIKKKNSNVIFINLNDVKLKKKNIYNFKIYQLKKILKLLKSLEIQNIIFIGKISRPNLKDFKYDGEIEKYIPILLNSYKKGDGAVLSSVIKIFKSKGFKIIKPKYLMKDFYFNKVDLSKIQIRNDKTDIIKSCNILNDLSKYDNAQSIVCVNGYIIAIEAAEGTDNLLKRVHHIRKNLNQLSNKAGVLTKIPKKNQSKLIDLPVIGIRTLSLVRKANLSGIAVNPKYTLVKDKVKFLNLANEYSIKIYSVNN